MASTHQPQPHQRPPQNHQPPQQQQQQQSSCNSQLSMSDVSKFFNLPLSDAADSLGVSNSTLKKICLDNGLVRWPYRKFLSGKSIEDIMKETAQERKMEPAELLKSTIDRKDDATKMTVPTVGPALQNRTAIPVHEFKGRSFTNQLGNKNIQTATVAIIDEFKYGFPSDGLSRTSNKWWGSSSSCTKNEEDNYGKGDGDKKQQSDKNKIDTEDTNTSTQLSGAGLLSAVRKRAVDEGRKVLKLGVHCCSGINKPRKREILLLHGIFGSSLPKEWINGPS